MAQKKAGADVGKDQRRREHLSRKGEFRSYYVRMLDEDEFQSFAPETQRAFFYLKGRLGQWGVDVMYPAELAARMRVDLEVVSVALDELTRAGWLRTEKNVCWLVNGLRHEPWYEPGNANHLVGLKKSLRGLPQVPLLDEVVEAYSTPPADTIEAPDEEDPAAPQPPAQAPEPPRVKPDPNRKFDPDEDLEWAFVDGRPFTGSDAVRLWGPNEPEDSDEDDDEWEEPGCAA